MTPDVTRISVPTLTVWKFQLPGEFHRFRMPIGSSILTVQAQDGEPTFWALVDPTRESETRTFIVVPTGQPVYKQHLYVGTAQCGALVWHVFEDTA